MSTAGTDTIAPAPIVDPLPPAVTAPAEFSAGCLDGPWYIRASRGGTADVNDVIGVALSISKIEWALSASDASATVGTEEIRFDGTASGPVTIDGDAITFTPGEAVGTVDGSLDFAGLTELLVPLSGAGQRTCDGLAATLEDTTATVSLDRRPGIPSQVDGLPPVEVTDQGGNDDIECRGRSFIVSGSSNSYAFLGSCPSVEVTGNSNSIAIEYTDKIAVSGTNNSITYRAGLSAETADVVDVGTGNTVTRS
jgi:hypothetical protein